MQAETTAPPVQEIGGTVDEFTLPGVNGDAIRLAALLEGKKGAVVVFWSGVCSHCIRYDGYFNGFARSHPELALVVVASRAGETPEQIRKTMSERGILFRIAHDAGSAVARQWSTQQTPRAFLIDAERKLFYRGSIDNFRYPGDPEYAAHLESAIEDFLASRPLRRADTPSFGCAIQSVYYTLPKHLSK